MTRNTVPHVTAVCQLLPFLCAQRCEFHGLGFMDIGQVIVSNAPAVEDLRLCLGSSPSLSILKPFSRAPPPTIRHLEVALRLANLNADMNSIQVRVRCVALLNTHFPHNYLE